MIILPVKVPDITTLFSPAGSGALLRKISAGTQNLFLVTQKNFTRHAEKFHQARRKIHEIWEKFQQKQKCDKSKQGKLREEGSLAILRKFSAGMRQPKIPTKR